jgi:molybdopterin/thiamine biosynthesis adenylyltransferase/rhodanese-related sulfurtransferase
MSSKAASIGPNDAHRTEFDAVFDIRPHASSTPTIGGAQLVPGDRLTASPTDFIASKTDSVLIVCDIGLRSAVVTELLLSAGYEFAVSLDGGLERWTSASLPTEAPQGLSRDEFLRYDRQLKLPSIGVAGQRALAESRVAIVGAGGLGAPVISYLCGAGIGHLTIIDSDRVEVSNLHRQPIYTMRDVGRHKSETAAAYAVALNPTIEVSPVTARIDGSNAVELLGDHDVVVTCTDSFDTAHAINRAAVDMGIPMVFGSVYRTEGQFSVFDASTGPCYACVFPSDRGGFAMDCSIVGVLGTVTGIVGSIQATETIKLITDAESSIVGSLGLYDAQTQTIDSLVVRKNPSCAVCGHDVAVENH